MTDMLAEPRPDDQMDDPATSRVTNNSDVQLDEWSTVRIGSGPDAQLVRWFRTQPSGRWCVLLVGGKAGRRATVVGWAPAEVQMTAEIAQEVITDAVRAERAKGTRYPLPRPVGEEKPRFTYGLSFDVAAVLVKHGYPELQGQDLERLRLALYNMIYEAPAAAPERELDTGTTIVTP